LAFITTRTTWHQFGTPTFKEKLPQQQCNTRIQITWSVKQRPNKTALVIANQKFEEYVGLRSVIAGENLSFCFSHFFANATLPDITKSELSQIS
jgi:hypothetical protein